MHGTHFWGEQLSLIMVYYSTCHFRSSQWPMELLAQLIRAEEGPVGIHHLPRVVLPNL